MCDSVPLAKTDDRQCVSSSLLPQDRRNGSDFSTAYVLQGITTAKVTLFLSIKNPLNKQRFFLRQSLLLFLSTSTVFRPLPCWPISLSAGAGLDGHIGVNFEHWVPGFILEQHSQRTHFFWDTAGLRNSWDDPNGSDYALDGGVVRWPHHLGEFEQRRGVQRRRSI